MGNRVINSYVGAQTEMNFTPVDQFTFLGAFEDDAVNGLCLNEHYLPEEIISNILSYIPPSKILNCSLVCRKWCNIIKSDHFWMNLYNRYYPNKAKQLPWYVYYSFFTTRNFHNLIKNGNGEEKFKYWKILKNFGDEFQIENPPAGADQLPSCVEEFNGKTSCFATSYYECNKIQQIQLKHKRLLRYIMKKHKPHIYVSEWMAGRFDCGCRYQLGILGYGDTFDRDLVEAENSSNLYKISSIEHFFHKTKEETVEQWQGKAWKKVEILVDKYPENVTTLVFEHEGHDTQFWKGHYGSKMAGGVVKFLLDSIEPANSNET